MDQENREPNEAAIGEVLAAFDANHQSLDLAQDYIRDLAAGKITDERVAFIAPAGSREIPEDAEQRRRNTERKIEAGNAKLEEMRRTRAWDSPEMPVLSPLPPLPPAVGQEYFERYVKSRGDQGQQFQLKGSAWSDGGKAVRLVLLETSGTTPRMLQVYLDTDTAAVIRQQHFVGGKWVKI